MSTYCSNNSEIKKEAFAEFFEKENFHTGMSSVEDASEHYIAKLLGGEVTPPYAPFDIDGLKDIHDNPLKLEVKTSGECKGDKTGNYKIDISNIKGKGYPVVSMVSTLEKEMLFFVFPVNYILDKTKKYSKGNKSICFSLNNRDKLPEELEQFRVSLEVLKEPDLFKIHLEETNNMEYFIMKKDTLSVKQICEILGYSSSSEKIKKHLVDPENYPSNGVLPVKVGGRFDIESSNQWISENPQLRCRGKSSSVTKAPAGNVSNSFETIVEMLIKLELLKNSNPEEFTRANALVQRSFS